MARDLEHGHDLPAEALTHGLCVPDLLVKAIAFELGFRGDSGPDYGSLANPTLKFLDREQRFEYNISNPIVRREVAWSRRARTLEFSRFFYQQPVDCWANQNLAVTPQPPIK